MIWSKAILWLGFNISSMICSCPATFLAVSHLWRTTNISGIAHKCSQGQVCVPTMQQVDIFFAQKLARSSNVSTSSGNFTSETLPLLLPSPGRLRWIEIIVVQINCDVKVILIYVVKCLDDMIREKARLAMNCQAEDKCPVAIYLAPRPVGLIAFRSSVWI